MENRYLLGSSSQSLSKGSSNNLTLRIVRPMLPIERLWTYRQGEEMEVKWYDQAKDIAKGTSNDRKTQGYLNNDYPVLKSQKYRLPKYAELMPIFHNCKKQLETGQKIGKTESTYMDNEYGYFFQIITPGDYFALNGNQYKFDNWFCAVRGSRVLYGIMNRKPAPARGNTTGNYKYAVKMTFEDPKEDKGIARIQVYYLGPNYNLSLNTTGYYCCHESFWNKLDTKDIIDRRVRVGGDYWLNYDETHQAYEKRSKYNKITLDAIVQDAHDSFKSMVEGWSLHSLVKRASMVMIKR